VAVRLDLVVIYAGDLQQTKQIYEVIGLEFTREKHGAGPEHFAATLDGVVLEVYPRKIHSDLKQIVRLGFRVPSVDVVLERLAALKVEIVTHPHDTPWGRRAAVRDPDGYTIDLSS